MRVAVIGAGSIGKRHLANLRALGHEAVVIDTRSSVRDWARGEGYETRDVGTSTQLDAVVIATPAPSHLYWLQDCVARHLPVLVEKPLGILADLSALRELRPAAPVMVAYNWRFNSEVMALFARHQHSVITAHFICQTRMPEWPGRAYGDPVLECSHDIDLAMMYSQSHTLRGGGSLDGPAGVWLQFDSVIVDLRWNAEPRREYLILANKPTWFERYAGVPGCRVVDRLEPSQASIDASYQLELAHFLLAVEGGPVAPGCTLEEGIAVLDVVRQAKELT